MTPNEIFAYHEVGAGSEQDGWRVRVVPNKFAALMPDGDFLVEHPEIFTTMNGIGYHDVIIESPAHNLTLGNMGCEQCEEVVLAYTERFAQLAREPHVRYVSIFRNHGATAGTSLTHPHSQVIATPVVPAHARQEIEEARRHYDDRVRCVYCDIVETELRLEQRVILDNAHYVTVAPFAPRWPFEMKILPKRHNSSFADLTHGEVRGLAQTLCNTLGVLYRAAGNPDYNLTLHTAPLHDSCEDYYHWHIEIYPRLATQAGFELGTGIYINTVFPEDTASFLRAALAEGSGEECVLAGADGGH
jgi:UDPglucose--hexose-1-phosphate uridylyltransferase